MLLTITKNNNVLCKSMHVEYALDCLKEEIGQMKTGEEFDLHVWREV